ncbi:MAG: DUF1080 domain-containing protein [Gemmataceae bacterium]|nr:DUF1080 domain-containing protein [Gemmataceae bacterium]
MRVPSPRHWLPLVALAVGLTMLGSATLAADDKKDEGFTELFNGKDFTGFKFEVGKNDPTKTWSVDKGVIICTGKPAGYFYTEKPYKDYVLKYDWRYKRPDGLEDEEKFGGNSGCLVHIQEPHKVWPKCVEVQGENRTHGNIFAIGGAKGKFKFDKAALQKARNKVGEWNTTEIISKDGMLTAKVNGAEVSSGQSEDVKEGPIGFQSEGAEIHFRNIKIKPAK